MGYDDELEVSCALSLVDDSDGRMSISQYTRALGRPTLLDWMLKLRCSLRPARSWVRRVLSNVFISLESRFVCGRLT